MNSSAVAVAVFLIEGLSPGLVCYAGLLLAAAEESGPSTGLGDSKAQEIVKGPGIRNS